MLSLQVRGPPGAALSHPMAPHRLQRDAKRGAPRRVRLVAGVQPLGGHYTMIHFSLQLCVGKSRVFTTSNVLAILYLFSVT